MEFVESNAACINRDCQYLLVQWPVFRESNINIISVQRQGKNSYIVFLRRQMEVLQCPTRVKNDNMSVTWSDYVLAT